LEAVRLRDDMLHHPFNSFVSLETLLKAAVKDPSVVHDNHLVRQARLGK
jgi:polyphosphate kinase